MVFKVLLLVLLCAVMARAQIAPTPDEVNGVDGGSGGVFGGNMTAGAAKGLPAFPKGERVGDTTGSIFNGGKAGGGWIRAVADNSGGSGPFNAWWTSDASFPNHTIYVPRKVDPTIKLPVVVWGNGEYDMLLLGYGINIL